MQWENIPRWGPVALFHLEAIWISSAWSTEGRLLWTPGSHQGRTSGHLSTPWIQWNTFLRPLAMGFYLVNEKRLFLIVWKTDILSLKKKIHWKHQHLLSCHYIPTTVVDAAASKNRQSLSLNNLKSSLQTLSNTSILRTWSDMLATSGKISNRPSPYSGTPIILPPSVTSSVDSLSSQFPSALRVSSPLRYPWLSTVQKMFLPEVLALQQSSMSFQQYFVLLNLDLVLEPICSYQSKSEINVKTIHHGLS